MAEVSKIFSAELDGIEAKLIEVETDINVGLHAFNIVGLADKALSEAKERVNSALKNIGVKPPSKENRRIVINLAPADIKKTGSQYDLSIAVGYLLATGQIKEFPTEKIIFAGELSLEGKLRPINGSLNIADLARRLGFDCLILPAENAQEAAMVEGVKIIPARGLKEIISYLEGKEKILPQEKTKIETNRQSPFPDISEIKGQEGAKRALCIAAAGGHNILMIGPPGTGKTMLAQALSSILPPPELSEVIEVTKIYSSAGLLGSRPFINWRPFRAPHQSASPASIIGGGQNPRPGEISLAHRGVLFLDEMPEFRRDLLEALRQPLESGLAFISRVKGNLALPAKFILAAAMNPCPCGFYGDNEKECRCSANEILRYQKKISGPLLDRIDIQINVPRVSIGELRSEPIANSQALGVFQDRIKNAREIQKNRLKNTAAKLINSELNSKECEELIKITPEAERFLKEAFNKALISARGYYRILKVGRTIADLAGSEKVERNHLAEAFNYRLREAE